MFECLTLFVKDIKISPMTSGGEQTAGSMKDADYSNFLSDEELNWIEQHISTAKKSRRVSIGTFLPEILPGTSKILVLAPDWAGLTDAVSGKIHQLGYNIRSILGFVKNNVGIVCVELLIKDKKGLTKLKKDLESFEEYIKVVGKGGGATRQILQIAVRKTDIFKNIVSEISRIVDKDTFRELVSEEGEVVKFVISRSEAYLLERKPGDLARQILLNYEFQKKLREKGRGVLVKAENIWTLGGWVTGITVAGMDRDLSLDDVMDELREYIPFFHREYDKQFISRDGITVIRLEITDGQGNPLPEENLPLLENYLTKKLDRPKHREPLNIRLSVELFGRLVIPRLIEEALSTGVPQFYLLPGRTTKDEAHFKLAVVKKKSENESFLLTSLVETLSKIDGISVQSSKAPSISRGCEIEILSLKAELGKFESEEEIYTRMKLALKELVSGFRDFDEGMRKLDRTKLLETEKLLNVQRESDKRFTRAYFFSMEDFHRLQSPVEHIVKEITLAYDCIIRHSEQNRPVLEIQETDHAILVCLVSPEEPALYEKILRIVSDYPNMVLTRLDDYGLSMFTIVKKKGKPHKDEINEKLSGFVKELFNLKKMEAKA